MNRCTDLDTVEQYKHELMDILDGLNIQVDNLVEFLTFLKHMNKLDDPVSNYTLNLAHKHQIDNSLALLSL